MSVVRDSTAGGFISMDYLRSEINRPDLYEEQTTMRSSILRKKLDTSNIVITIGTIIISAFIFITIVAWASVLQSFFDYLFINAIILSQFKARLVYAVVITIISFVLCTILLYWYINHYNPKHNNSHPKSHSPKLDYTNYRIYPPMC